MDILNGFFDKISWRLKKETNLSDITWALLSISECFKNVFFEYCFGMKITLGGNIEREYNRDGSIPDFYFEDLSGKEYIIENKIFDRGDHFKQYEKAFPNATRAFIANYKESEHDGWFIRNWKEFILFLSNNDDCKKLDKEENDLIKAYIVYLKSITYFWEATSMNFKNLSSLNSFYGIISELIDEKGFQSYNIASAINSMYYGQYFFFPNENEQNVYIWLGIYIPEETGIYIKFEKFKNESWLPKTEQNKITKMAAVGVYYDNIDEEDGNFYIHLKDEYYEKFCDNIDVNIQKDIVKKFLEEILTILK